MTHFCRDIRERHPGRNHTRTCAPYIATSIPTRIRNDSRGWKTCATRANAFNNDTRICISGATACCNRAYVHAVYILVDACIISPSLVYRRDKVRLRSKNSASRENSRASMLPVCRGSPSDNVMFRRKKKKRNKRVIVVARNP